MNIKFFIKQWKYIKAKDELWFEENMNNISNKWLIFKMYKELTDSEAKAQGPLAIIKAKI